MVSSGWGASVTWNISPVPATCSCKNTIKSAETAIKEGTFLGSSTTKFDEQWAVTADVKLNELPDVNKLQSLVEVSIKKVADFRKRFEMILYTRSKFIKNL